MSAPDPSKIEAYLAACRAALKAGQRMPKRKQP
jgi:hypothetical protein